MGGDNRRSTLTLHHLVGWDGKGYTVGMIAQVLQAVQDAFHPAHVEHHLRETDGRVYGSVEVVGSSVFDNLDDVRR